MEYELKRSARKTLAVEISRDGRVIVRAPERMPQKKIDAFIAQHSAWIADHLAKQKARAAANPPLTPAQISALRQKAREYLPRRTAAFAAQMGVTYTSLKITSAQTRYGSCSGKNGICFSLYLMQKPLYAVDYVIVHELAHTVHHNHGAQFYALIESVLPDYKERIRVLKHECV